MSDWNTLGGLPFISKTIIKMRINLLNHEISYKEKVTKDFLNVDKKIKKGIHEKIMIGLKE